MMLSLNEIEAETRKAVRGAGLPWGLAEEGGKAMRWLAGHGVDATPALADILDRHARGEIDAGIAADEAGRWTARRRQLCPLTLGVTLCDHAWLVSEGRSLAAGEVVRPLLLLPFAARAAQIAGRALALVAGRQQVNFCSRGEPAGLLTFADIAEAASVSCEAARSGVRGLPHDSWERPALDRDAWQAIETFALRTYVPASEHSRRHGAGAGQIDND
ncbi:MAG: DUF3726 domain-containing protein [Pseudorhodoplanes sp.]